MRPCSELATDPLGTVASRRGLRRGGAAWRFVVAVHTLIRLLTHTYTHTYTCTSRRNHLWISWSRPTCCISGSRDFSSAGARPGPPSRRRRMRREADRGARATFAKIGRRECEHARVCQTHAMSNLYDYRTRKVKWNRRAYQNSKDQHRWASREKRRGAIRHAKTALKSLKNAEERAARHFAYRQLHVYTAIVAPQRGWTKHRYRRRRDAEKIQQIKSSIRLFLPKNFISLSIEFI